MSIIIKYEPERGIFEALVTLIPDKKESLALDALRVIFQCLLETTKRIDEKFKTLGKQDPQNIQKYIDINSEMYEIWILIDNIHRISKIYSYLPIKFKQKALDLFKNITVMRDSFHHLEERIEHHFSEFGGSVFGDISWRNRANKGESEWLYKLISGTKVTGKGNYNLGQVEDERFKDKIGVYDFIIEYIKIVGNYSAFKRNKTKPKYEKITINLDEAVDMINDYILELEYYYSELIIKNPNLESLKDRSLPCSIGVRIKQEAWDRNNKH